MRPSIEQELLSREHRYWDAIQAKDESVAMSLSDEECIVVGAQGIGELDRHQIGEMLKQASYELTHYEFDDKTVKVRKVTDDVVIIAYAVHEDVVVDGKPESLVAFDSSVWVRRGADWVCALHTESLKGDPFGRYDLDRMTTADPAYDGEPASGAI